MNKPMNGQVLFPLIPLTDGGLDALADMIAALEDGPKIVAGLSKLITAINERHQLASEMIRRMEATNSTLTRASKSTSEKQDVAPKSAALGIVYMVFVGFLQAI